MRFKIVLDQAGKQQVAVEHNNTWKIARSELSLLEYLGQKDAVFTALSLSDFPLSEYKETIPFRPSAYRDFMLYEKHAIDAARGFVKKYMSHLLPVVNTYEKVFRKPFPKLKPKKRYYQHPIYYMGNHLNFITHNDSIAIPAYTEQLDYELELAAVITKPLKNASIEAVNDAIGGYLILNDFSARDVQLDEMDSGFGPMKTKNFGSAISSTVLHKTTHDDQVDNLKVKVVINDKTILESNTQGKLYTFAEAIAYASWEEQLHPGEIFGSGTIPGCTGIENGVMLNKGDTITLEVETIGQLTNKIC